MRKFPTTSLIAITCALGLAACAPEPAQEDTAEEITAETAEPVEDAAMTEDMADDAAATEETADTEEVIEAPAPEPVPLPAAEAKPEPVAKAPPPPPPAPEPEPVKVAAAVTEPPAIFKQRCAMCHTIDKGGADKLGPNLYGVYGEPVAQGDFKFSTALAESGLVLDEATLHQWLENPRKLVPGNRMSFPGLKKPEQRQEIIDYMKSQG